MSAFTDRESSTWRATPGRLDGSRPSQGRHPHVVPVGWRFNRELDTIDVGGMNLPRTKKSGTSAATAAPRS